MNVVIARWHGTFTAGKDLDQAYLFTSLAEHCCKVLQYTKFCRQILKTVLPDKKNIFSEKRVDVLGDPRDRHSTDRYTGTVD